MTARRELLASLALLLCTNVAAQSLSFYVTLSKTWLTDARRLDSELDRAIAEQSSSHSKLERKLAKETRASREWQAAETTGASLDKGMRGHSQRLKVAILAEERFLRVANRSRNIDISSMGGAFEDNLRARIAGERAVAKEISQCADLATTLAQQMEAIKSAAGLPEFAVFLRATMASRDLLRNVAAQAVERALRYETMAGTVIPSASAAKSTFRVPLGAAGDLAIEYQVASSSEYGSFRNRVFGRVVNNTGFALTCPRIEPTTSANGSALMLTIFNTRIPAHGEFPFSNEDRSSNNLQARGVASWSADCRIPIRYRFVNDSPTVRFAGGVARGSAGLSQIGLMVENNSSEPLEIVWNESSYIDETRSAKRVFHTAVKYADREQSLPNTIVPPGARVQDAAVPSANVYFVEGRDGGWREHPLLLDAAPPELALSLQSDLKGAKMSLFLQLLAGGKKIPVTLVFEIAEVTIGN